MLENIVNLLLGSSGRFKQMTESAIKVLLTITIAVCSLPTSDASSIERQFINAGSMPLFRLIPDFLLLLIFYLFYWYIFYAFLPSLEAGIILRKIAKGLKHPQTTITGQEAVSVANQQMGGWVGSIFAYFGILTLIGEEIRLGPIGLLVAPGIARQTAEGETESLLSDVTSPFVVLEMGIIYMFYLRPSLGVPLLWTVLFLFSGTLLVVALFLADLFRLFIRLFQNQLAPMFQQLASPSTPKPNFKS